MMRVCLAMTNDGRCCRKPLTSADAIFRRQMLILHHCDIHLIPSLKIVADTITSSLKENPTVMQVFRPVLLYFSYVRTYC